MLKGILESATMLRHPNILDPLQSIENEECKGAIKIFCPFFRSLASTGIVSSIGGNFKQEIGNNSTQIQEIMNNHVKMGVIFKVGHSQINISEIKYDQLPLSFNFSPDHCDYFDI